MQVAVYSKHSCTAVIGLKISTAWRYNQAKQAASASCLKYVVVACLCSWRSKLSSWMNRICFLSPGRQLKWETSFYLTIMIENLVSHFLKPAGVSSGTNRSSHRDKTKARRWSDCWRRAGCKETSNNCRPSWLEPLSLPTETGIIFYSMIKTCAKFVTQFFFDRIQKWEHAYSKAAFCVTYNNFCAAVNISYLINAVFVY